MATPANQITSWQSNHIVTRDVVEIFFRGAGVALYPGGGLKNNYQFFDKFGLGHPVLSSEFYNSALSTDFVAAVGILEKNSPFESWHNLIQFLSKKNFPVQNLTRQVNVRTFDRVSKLRAHYPCRAIIRRGQLQFFLDTPLDTPLLARSSYALSHQARSSDCIIGVE